MGSEPLRVARIDRHELRDLPADWSERERGQYLRLLFQLKGIDPNRFYHVTYHPHPRCWLLTQEAQAGKSPPPGLCSCPGKADELFYRHAMTQLRLVSRTAWAALAAHSPHFARCGAKYQLPPASQEVTPGDLANLFGGPAAAGPTRTYFDAEGGWQARRPSDN
jgi:hypothetical protein